MAKKLRLDPEALRVDSFEVAAPSGAGTVAGHQIGIVDPMPHEPVPVDPIREQSYDRGCNQSWADSCYFNTCYHNCTGDTWCDQTA